MNFNEKFFYKKDYRLNCSTILSRNSRLAFGAINELYQNKPHKYFF